MIRRLGGLAIAPLVVSLLLAPRVARAADAPATGADEVSLKDGSAVRGAIFSVKRGVRVQILEVGKTRPRTIPWARVRKVERGKFAAPSADAHPASAEQGQGQDHAADPTSATAGSPPPAQSAPASQSPPPANAVHLHIESPTPALLFSHESAGGTVDGHDVGVDRATLVCSAPCDKVLDVAPNQTFTANGDFMPSPSFTLGEHRGDVDLTLRPGNQGVRVAGDVLTVGGGVLAAVGATLVIVGEIVASTTVNVTVDGQPAKSTTGDGGGKWMVPTGAIVGGVGVAALVGGIVALVESRTSVELRPMATGEAKKKEIAPRYWMGEF